jgi:predicted nucleotidyltransferase
MPQWSEITAFCDQIVQQFRPVKIVLFGSYAYGTPTPESDVDILVMMPYRDSPGRAAADILQRTNPSFGVDLLVRTPEQVAERLAINDFFMREVMERGRVLYARGDT